MFLTSVPGLGWPQTHADWAVTWDALAAIGTFLAVVVALWFGTVEISRTRRRERTESQKDAALLLTRLNFVEEELEDGTFSKSTPLDLLNMSNLPFLDVHVVQHVGNYGKFKRLGSLEWVKSGEEYDIGFKAEPLTKETWIALFFKDTSGRTWLRPIYTPQGLHEVTLVSTEQLDPNDEKPMPDLFFTLKPKKELWKKSPPVQNWKAIPKDW